MLSLHQLRCFLTVYELGSLTAAAEELGYAQPSISEQIRMLEKSLGIPLFRRVGRGVVPTTAADTLRPHAEATIAAAQEAQHAVQRIKAFETGTIRFGMFGSARLYVSAGLVSDVLERYPGVRVEIIGVNSSEVIEDLRRGRLEAALIAAPPTSEGLDVRPVARDELVYVSMDLRRTASPVTARRLAEARLVLADTSYRATDSMRLSLRKMLHEAGHNPQTRIEVEDVETAIELTGRGLADTVVHEGAARQLVPRLAPGATWTVLRPRQYETFAIVHRVNATLSPAARLIIDLAVERIRAVAEPIGGSG
jgi:DNA-binding transcriptional LysR family regulator